MRNLKVPHKGRLKKGAYLKFTTIFKALKS